VHIILFFHIRQQLGYTCARVPEAVVHEVKLPVRGNERNGAVVLEAGEAHALVELDVLQLDGFALGLRPTSRFKHELVVQTQLQLRHA